MSNKNVIPPFLKKLRYLIENVDPSTAGFDDEGRVFEVLNVKKFEEELKNVYKGTPSTFVRQLHFYSFTKGECERNLRGNQVHRALPGAWSFSHPLLFRDNLDLLSQIQRQERKEAVSALAAAETIKESDGENVVQLRKIIKSMEKSMKELKAKVDYLTKIVESNGLTYVDDSLNSKKSSRDEASDEDFVLGNMKKAKKSVAETPQFNFADFLQNAVDEDQSFDFSSFNIAAQKSSSETPNAEDFASFLPFADSAVKGDMPKASEVLPPVLDRQISSSSTLDLVEKIAQDFMSAPEFGRSLSIQSFLNAQV